MIHYAGYLESGLIGSLSQLAIRNGIINRLEAFRKEKEINDDTLPSTLLMRLDQARSTWIILTS